MKRSEVERLYDEHAEGVFRFLLSLVRQPEDARDLLQDIFVRLARNDGFLERVDNERAFLLKMARHAAIDRSRRAGVRKRFAESEVRAPGPFAAAADPDAAAFRTHVAEALACLPEAQRTVVYLKLWEGLTFERAAEVCSVSPATAASRYRYGIEKLRGQLGPLYKEITE